MIVKDRISNSFEMTYQEVFPVVLYKSFFIYRAFYGNRSKTFAKPLQNSMKT